MNLLLRVIVLCALAHISIAQESVWSVLIYMEPMQDLHDAAWRNLNDLARCTQLNDQVDIRVQLHSYDNIAWRYRIKQGIFIQDSCVELTNNYVHDITDAAQWAYAGSSTYHALIFWGHGHGILTPTYNPETKKWEVEDDDAFQACELCESLPVPLLQEEHSKAILLNETTQKCLDNHQMIAVLENITDILGGRHLDLVGMDVCLGASLEHAYQIAPYTNYLVACQNCELSDGFEYHGLACALATLNSPTELTKEMLTDYGTYYESRAELGNYTLSVINCKKAYAVREQLDRVCLMLLDIIEHDPEMVSILGKIRSNSVNFCFVPVYTDLWQVFNLLKQELENQAIYPELVEEITQAHLAIKDAVLGNTTGHNMKQVHGMSIYFPYSHIDSSYPMTLFAQTSYWLSLLQQLCRN
ncbi:hypothetical protein JW872_01580 [Candidatus Babeliales bacterium]|nr:hypothetical protein [Candidatus Babeliales bacterium]